MASVHMFCCILDQLRLVDRAKESAEAERLRLLELVKTLEIKLNSVEQVWISYHFFLKIFVNHVPVDFRRGSLVTSTAKIYIGSGKGGIREGKGIYTRETIS